MERKSYVLRERSDWRRSIAASEKKGGGFSAEQTAREPLPGTPSTGEGEQVFQRLRKRLQSLYQEKPLEATKKNGRRPPNERIVIAA